MKKLFLIFISSYLVLLFGCTAELKPVAEQDSVSVSTISVPSASPDTPSVWYAWDGSNQISLSFNNDDSVFFSRNKEEPVSLYRSSDSFPTDLFISPDCNGSPVLHCEKIGTSLSISASEMEAVCFTTNPNVLSSVTHFPVLSSSVTPVITSCIAQRSVIRVCFNTDISFVLASKVNSADPNSSDWYPCSGKQVSLFKTDGDYYIFGKTADDQISPPTFCSVRSGYNYVIDGEGLEPITIPISDFLDSCQNSIARINRYIADCVTEAGMYSRPAVATAAVSLVSALAKHNAAAPYQGQGRYSEKEDWGIPERWGSPLPRRQYDNNGSYTIYGLHCAASSVWAYKQAGLNTVSTRKNVALFGFGRHSGNYKDNIIPVTACQTGDLLKTTTTHTMLVLDRLDQDEDGAADAYLTLEMVNPIMTLSIHPFRRIRSYTAYDMSGLFDNTGEEKRFAAYWPDTYFIPFSAWPDYMQDSSNCADIRNALYLLSESVGLEVHYDN